MSDLVETDKPSVSAKRESLSDDWNLGDLEALATAGEKSCILTYHEILPENSTYIYRVTNSLFEKHLSFISSLREKSSAQVVPQITLDDGHRSNYENAFPILERFDVKATFFVLAGCVGTNANYFRWEQARELASAGHRVASHGWSHRMLTQCSSPELDQEISQSKREIEDRLGVEVHSISAPGGRWDERVVDACTRAGYKYLFHSNPWVPVSPRIDIRLQGRHMVTGRMDSQYLRKLMQMSGVERRYLRARYAAKERVRLILGDQLYHKLWCWIANWSPGEGMELEVEGRANANGKSKL
jgi:peptidoglycan/xylan/chitin deacetylase (PgdA/CDA1 family)